MDIISLVKKQIEQIEKFDKSIYLNAIKIHLERAEIYLEKGVEDSYYYNDVIYRTNQAYEGALKESYKVLAQKSSKEVEKDTPFRIEKFFESNSIFKERVLELFGTYRNNWRNKSTHDYKLFFDENEAFIALVTVSAFVHLLLKQINEKLIYNQEEHRLKKVEGYVERLNKLIETEKTLHQKLTLLLAEYFEENKIILSSKIAENEIQSMVNAYLNGIAIDFQVELNPEFEKFLRPDFLVKNLFEKVIIEIKKYLIQIKIEPAIEQLLTYMSTAEIERGILLALAIKSSHNKITIKKIKKTINGKIYYINIIEN